jgi:hypothetical protein
MFLYNITPGGRNVKYFQNLVEVLRTLAKTGGFSPPNREKNGSKAPCGIDKSACALYNI